MDRTDNLNLPYIMPAQAQKHVTHNEAIRALDALVQIAVQTRGLSSPPALPANGARYIVAAPASDDWVSHEGEIAAYQDDAWAFYPPQIGWVAWVMDEANLFVWSGVSWLPVVNGSTDASPETSLPWLGINATADASNRLLVSSSATLFNHEGSDHRLSVNKFSISDTASVLFQSDFSARAEIGLTGDDDCRIKVSPDGSTWLDALTINKNTGRIEMPNTEQQTGLEPVYFLGFANNADTFYAENDRVSLSTDNTGGGIDSHTGFNTSTNIFTVPISGVYQCTIVTNLKSIPPIGRAGSYMAVSRDGGATWENIFRAMANKAADVFGSNIAMMNLMAGDLVCMQASAPGGGTAQYWSNTRLALIRIAGV